MYSQGPKTHRRRALMAWEDGSAGNVKMQAPFPYNKIGMLVGGTGMSPMTQALHAILGDTTDVQVSMIYGSRNQDDILGKEVLNAWASSGEHSDLLP
jgi:NAD(P)H-flavin reductase